MTVTLLTSQSTPTATDADALVIGVLQGPDDPVPALDIDDIDLLAALTALVALVHNLVAGAMPGLHGTVFPGRTGDTVTVQVRHHGGWSNVTTTKLAAGGYYWVQVPGAGTYRVVYDGMDGAPVRVSLRHAAADPLRARPDA